MVAGADYGTGSSRDWAAKGTMLLGVRAIIAEGFERIHRSNLIGMGVLPLQFVPGETRKTLVSTAARPTTFPASRPSTRSSRSMHHSSFRRQRVSRYFAAGSIPPMSSNISAMAGSCNSCSAERWKATALQHRLKPSTTIGHRAMTWLVEDQGPHPSGRTIRRPVSSPARILKNSRRASRLCRNPGAPRTGSGRWTRWGAITTMLGLPDLGVMTMEEVCFFVRSIYRATGLPILVDGDTGYGEALNVIRLVRELEDAGAGAVQIEDQLLPKKCGHLNDKKLAQPAGHGGEDRRSAQSAEAHLRIVARTDAMAQEGTRCRDRACQTLSQAGADSIFPEALTNADMFERFARGDRCAVAGEHDGVRPHAVSSPRSEFAGFRFQDRDLAGHVVAGRRRRHWTSSTMSWRARARWSRICRGCRPGRNSTT